LVRVRAQARLSRDAQHAVAARSGSTQRDETKTILHIWQSTEQSDPFDDLHGDVGAQLGQKSFEDVRGALDGDVHADERL